MPQVRSADMRKPHTQDTAYSRNPQVGLWLRRWNHYYMLVVVPVTTEIHELVWIGRGNERADV